MTRRVRRGSQIPPFSLRPAGSDAASERKPVALSLSPSPSPSRSHCRRKSGGYTALFAVSASLLLAELLACGGGGASTNSTTGTSGGAGQAALSGFSCTSGSVTGAGTDSCTVTLNAAAGDGGQAVNLSSSVTAVTVPTAVTVAAGASSANFTAMIAAVSASEAANLTASSGGATLTYAISLSAAGQPVPTPTLSLQSNSVGFGNVDENTPAYQSVTLTSSGTAAVTVSAGTVSGAGYTISGVTFPSTLNPGATATLQIEFDPTTTGLANGTVSLTSNSSTGATASISLTGTGVAPSYEVNLTWDAPTSSSDPVAGYNIFRAISGTSTYQLVNSQQFNCVFRHECSG
jgi:hypothetical protein